MAEERTSVSWLNSRRLTAVILLIIAALALLARIATVPVGHAIPLIMGVIFVVAAALTRRDGYLVPGGILSGLGTGLLLQRLMSHGRAVDEAIFLLCLAGGFGLITLLNTALFRRRVLWPLWPGIILGVIGLATLTRMNLQSVFTVAGDYWPLILIAVALWLLFTRGSKK